MFANKASNVSLFYILLTDNCSFSRFLLGSISKVWMGALCIVTWESGLYCSVLSETPCLHLLDTFARISLLYEPIRSL